jgi:hypothetical protein
MAKNKKITKWEYGKEANGYVKIWQWRDLDYINCKEVYNIDRSTRSDTKKRDLSVTLSVWQIQQINYDLLRSSSLLS